MSDDPIQRLNTALEGRYRVERELGEGGMATVYVAEDLRHDRDVALKVLKPELGAIVGAERFLAEIRVTANLQHPNILPLFDSGEADKLLFYVMPLVEGESLRERLDREKQLPVDEAVKIITEVADALDHAHQKGVIHRDIKPANILLSGGRPLVADFGIALAVTAAGGGRLTETGLSVGTPYYMAPEQATADREVSPVSDVYSLACVLYEMLVGEPPHTGPSAQAVLTKILTQVPAAPRDARESVPANVDAAIRKALEKLPADRITSAREFAKALADPRFQHGGEEAGLAAQAARGPWNRLSVGFATASAVLALALVWALLSGTDGSMSRVVRFTVQVGEGAEVYLGGGTDARWGRPTSTSLAISPDGERLVYSAWEVGPDGTAQAQLYGRGWEEERADPIPGTEGASTPFFSHDGAWIGFFVGSSLRRVPVAGGDPETIVPDADVPAQGPRGASWGEDGTIVYGGTDGLYRVEESGGEAKLVAEVDTLLPGFVRYAHPHMLPGSRVLLFHRWRSIDPEWAEIVALDLESGILTGVLSDAMDPHYAETGQLLFMRQGTLMAVGFDLGRLEVEGQQVIVLENVMQAVGMPNSGWETGAAQVAVSRSGHLAYASGGVYPAESKKLMRVGLDGEAEPLGLDPQDFIFPRVSPEGDRLVFGVAAGWASTLHVYDLVRRVPVPLNTGGYANEWPIWSPDGDSIAFRSDRDGPTNVYGMPADGSGEPKRLAPSDHGQQPASWSSEGVIAYLQGGDIWVLPPGGEPAPFFTSDQMERYPSFSPDGRWVVYTSERLGTDERAVYLQPYPGPGGATLVSAGAVSAPTWSRDGRRIYYLEGMNSRRRRMMVVDVTPGDPLEVGSAVPLVDPWIFGTTTPLRAYDVFPDGSFVAILNEVNQAFGDEASPLRPERRRNSVGELHVILNFFEELRERVGG